VSSKLAEQTSLCVVSNSLLNKFVNFLNYILLQLPGKLNKFDGSGELPLDIALQTRQESIASTLVKHCVNVDMADQTGCCLLHEAIKRGQSEPCNYSR